MERSEKRRIASVRERSSAPAIARRPPQRQAACVTRSWKRARVRCYVVRGRKEGRRKGVSGRQTDARDDDAAARSVNLLAR
jgi:hypothetical protein